MVNIRFWNKERYVRFAMHMCVTYHTINLPLRLGGSANVPILVCLIISRTSVVKLQQVS